MNYSFKELTVEQLVELIDKDKVDLSPSYQRNFIWSPQDQNELVDTIIKGYPLPSFFIYEKNDGNFEMVDGQQRSRTIFKFVKGQITSSRKFGRLKFSEINQKLILGYKLPFIYISNLSKDDSLQDFYVLINKKGKHVNVAEVTKSEFHDSAFLKLSEEVLEYQNLINLDLFTEAASKRMNDRAFIEELLAYLELGIKDKKEAVEQMYEKSLNQEEYRNLRNRFYSIIDVFAELNRSYPIRNSRYKQKNDFYTFFNFVKENLNLLSIEIFKFQYEILIFLDGLDNNGRQFIRPSNEDCVALREYANNCVTQSNSKFARDKRLYFFNAVLKNRNVETNSLLKDILRYLGEIYGKDKIDLVKIGDFELLNIKKLN